MIKIKVVVPVCTRKWNEPARILLERYKADCTEIEVVNAAHGTESVETSYDETWAALFTLHEVERAEEEGFDGVVIYGFADPGLSASKERLGIPVVGLGEASFHVASLLGNRFSVIGIGPSRLAQAQFRRVTDRLKLSGIEQCRCASVKSVQIPVLDLDEDREGVLVSLLSIAWEAIKEDGADTIILGCGAFFGVKDKLAKELEVPVVVPGIAALKVCEGLIQMGLSPSKRSFGVPPEKKRSP